MSFRCTLKPYVVYICKYLRKTGLYFESQVGKNTNYYKQLHLWIVDLWTFLSISSLCFCVFFVPFRVRVHPHNIQQEALQQIPSYSDPSNQLRYRVNWRACTYCTVFVSQVALNTMFVRICIFYCSLSQMEQYDRHCLWLQSKVTMCVCRGRG